MNYDDYLDLDKILDSQKTLTSDRNELMFIVAHQASELWFKVLVRELSIDTNPDLKRITKIFIHLNTLFRTRKGSSSCESLSGTPPLSPHF